MNEKFDRSKLPELLGKQEFHLDLTPDDHLPIRILTAYLCQCGARWGVGGVDDNIKEIYEVMNKDQEKRAEIIRQAIKHLENFLYTIPDLKVNS